MNGQTRFKARFRWLILLLLAGFAVPAMAQNTKGEQPVNNQKQIRETKGKSIKRKDKAKTRDIAGRRLRTKNKSSANRANVGIRQPNPYAGRPRVTTDRAAKPRTRVYSERPSERPRTPKGDLAGHRLRTTKPKNNDAASANVYPQHGTFINHESRTPKPESHKRYPTTASGNRVVRRVPQQKERAWKGDIKGQPFVAPQSVSSQRKNTFPQNNRYSRYVNRKVPRERAVSNQREVGRVSRMTRPPATKGGVARGYPPSNDRGFVQRGRKNVYWGKFSKGEKPNTRDLTGAPLTKRNFRSQPAGLVGRDTLKYFGRKPGGDVNFAGKRQERLGVNPGQRGWRGDISGRRLRGNRPSTAGVAGEMVFPRKLSSSTTGERKGQPLPGAPFSQDRGRGEVTGRPIPGKSPGIGGKAVADGLRKTKGKPVKGFSAQGEGFSGTIKTKGKRGSLTDPAGYSGNIRKGEGKTFENQGEGFSGTIKVKGKRGFSDRQVGYSGDVRKGQGKTFENQGEGFSGYIKRQKPARLGGSVSGELWNNRQTAIAKRGIPADGQRVGGYSGNLRGQSKTFENQGEGFSGYIKARKPLKGGGSVSGQLWNNRNSPVGNKVLPREAERPGSYTGNLRGAQRNAFNTEGDDFTGYIKAQKPLKGGGSVSGKLWNNRNAPVDHKVLPRGADKPGTFSGNLRGMQRNAFNTEGDDFTGYMKAKKPLKGGGTVSGLPRNNNDSPVARKVLPSGSTKPGNYAGNLHAKQGKTMRETGGSFQGYDKAKKQEKGGGSISGTLWNNSGESVTQLEHNRVSIAVVNFEGRTKKSSAKPSTSGFDENGKNTVRRATKPGTSGFDDNGKNIVKRDFTQSPKAVDESTKKHTPNRDGFDIEGNKVTVARANYSKREHSVSGALKGVGPTRNSGRANEYSSGPTARADRRHNPKSADDAMKSTYYGGRTTARVGAFHGNVKVNKQGTDRRLHPDAKFAHIGENNVKEERTILTNVKLFWTKLFHKSESQPTNVKEKERRPRYDKGEIGMWAE